MPFLPPNQQRQSTEGKLSSNSFLKMFVDIVAFSNCFGSGSVHTV